jgi:uncharacterized membrane protein
LRNRREAEELMFIRVRDSHSRSIVKAVSWRVTGSLDTFVLGFIFTGSVKVAGSIAGAEAITKMILYYLHERAWSVIRWDQHGQADGSSSLT